MEIYEFLKDVDEINRAREIALRYAASILDDFRNLTPEGRKVMADTLYGIDFGGDSINEISVLKIFKLISFTVLAQKHSTKPYLPQCVNFVISLTT